MSTTPRILPVGDSALTIEFAPTHTPEANRAVRSLDSHLRERRPKGFREAVPTLRSLLVFYDPVKESFASFSRLLLALPEGAPQTRGRLHEIPTLYGEEAGPDLAEVARSKGLREADVIRSHTGREYTALMVGFTPGFAYLGGVDPLLEMPRRATPRTRVPTGSVGLARGFTGIYPCPSAGGWNLIGRTQARLFDPWREEPSLIRPGDRIRFVPVQKLEDANPPERPPSPSGTGEVAVVDGGLLTTVQDSGRPGYRRVGVSGGGPLDPNSLRAANRILGNAEDAPALEMTLQGPTLRFLRPVRFALTGADLGATLLRADLGRWACPLGAPIQARAGNLLAFGQGGVRGCLAFAGGIEVPTVLGSSSTDLLSGFGGYEGRALRAGDVLRLGRGPTRGEVEERASAPAQDVTVRVVLGPQEDHFDSGALERFLSEPFTLSLECDRVGLRLKGPRLSFRGEAEIPSDGMVPGSVEVPPSGEPIVMLADAPTTGGYPKIATVLTSDLHLLSQLRPGGGSVRFRAVGIEEAQESLRSDRS